jgi:hypothetical protein
MESILVKVRCDGQTYVARTGVGKHAVTASCTAGPKEAAKRCAAKAQTIGNSERLIAQEVDNQLGAGLCFAPTTYRVGYPLSEGGDL